VKRIAVMLLVLVSVATFSSTSQAAGNSATISFDAANGYPKSGTGTISGQGGYTISQGFTLRSITMTAIPNGGGTPITGTGGSNSQVTGPGGSVSGNWGDGNGNPLVLMKVPSGQYTVYATITVTDGTNNSSYTSAISVVNVP
jgi:hypothetical protein